MFMKLRMATPPFEKGDLVILKSGGPIMTVTGANDYDMIQAMWFAGKKREQGYFPPESLQPAPKDPKP